MSPGIPQVNLLVIGPGPAVEQLLAAVVTDGRAPVAIWQPGRPFELPAITPPGILVLRDVDTLVLEDQRRLLEWLEHSGGRMQVVSTASAPVLPLVDAGAFMQRLYYRLNTIYIDLSDGRTDPFDW